MQTTVRSTQGSQAVSKARSCASLSVVVVASGSSAVAAQAAQTLRSASVDLAAQLIVVSLSGNASLAASLERSLERSGVEFVSAPPGTTRAQMCDLGMRRARGSIVVLRDVDTVGDAGWLDAYRRILPKREVPVAESVVLESMAAGRALMADAAPSYSSRDQRG